MKRDSFRRLLGATSTLTLSAVAMLGALLPTEALSWTWPGIYGGGTTLSSQAFRQIFDCYAGRTVANDGDSFSSRFSTAAPSPGLLPASCTSAPAGIEGLFAAVGSGNGLRGFISDNPSEFFRGNPTSVPAKVHKPSKTPPFVDSGNPKFDRYPYPRVDFGASDSPLIATAGNALTTIALGGFTPATNWQNANSIVAATAAKETYNAAVLGQPIQTPVLQVPVAIAVNVHNPAHGASWNIQSALTPNTQPGGAIQLSTAQLCAIFSGNVHDWGDTATVIPYLDQNGAQQLQHFYDDNSNGSITPAAYVKGHVPISVVYRVDDSGTSYILTNYLASACPLLDPKGAFGYKKIFTGVGIGGATAPNLPSSKFDQLIANIRAVKGLDLGDSERVEDDSTFSSHHWIGAMGSAHAALKIGTDARHAGRIGYLSPDFTQPYAKTISEGVGDRDEDESSAAPLSASIQDENLRDNGVYHPGQAGSFGSPQNFVAPSPDSVQRAFYQLSPPSAATGYNDWNIYAQAYPAGATLGGVSVAGLSLISLPVYQGAYPISGATFLDFYSCYADSAGTRVPALTNWLAWFFGGSDAGLGPYSASVSNANNPGYDPNVSAIVRNNGFHEFSADWADTILATYVTPSSAGGAATAIAAYQTSGAQVDGCQGVHRGAF
jgi:ABC-type phosphate transport system substrate-binding protein